MKKLLAVCTTALHAVWLAPGRSSTPRHAHKRLRLTTKSVIRKVVGGSLATVLAVGMVGAAVVVPMASAGGNENSYWNHPENWEPLYSGSSCYKVDDGFKGSLYELPALDSTKKYVAVIVNAGSDTSTDGNANKVYDATQNGMPTSGMKVSSYDGKKISHVIICTQIVPLAPTFVLSQCTNPGQWSVASYDIHSTPGVKYYVKIDGGAYTLAASGTYYPASEQVITVQARTSDGSVVLATYPAVKFTSAGDCLTETHEAAASIGSQQLCDASDGTLTDGWITIPVSANVSYKIDGVTKAAGVYSYAPGTYTITVTADTGYKLSGLGSYQLTITEFGPCLIVAKDALATVTSQQTCNPSDGVLTSGSITIPSNEHVTYKIDGVTKAAGVYSYAPGTYTITVVADTGYKLSGPASYQLTLTEFGPCLIVTNEAQAIPSAQVCDAPTGVVTSGYIRIPTSEHVTFYIGDSTVAALPDSINPVAPGDYVIHVYAEKGYALTGPTSYTVNVASAHCPTRVFIDTDPSASSCTNLRDTSLTSWISVELNDGVVYKIDGVVVTSSLTSATPGEAHTVTATAVGDATLVGDHGEWSGETHSWTLTPGDTSQCESTTLPFLPSAVSSTNQVCTAAGVTGGSITVGQVDGDNQFGNGISYFIDGVKVTSVTTPKTPGTYHVTATLDNPLDSIDGESSWTITIAEPSASCGQLTTLAFTGVDGTMSALLIIALFLLLGGAGAYTAGHLRTRES